MYVVCDNMQRLDYAFAYPGSYVECLSAFCKRFPGVVSLNVYYDHSGKLKPGSYQYVATLNARQLRSFKDKYHLSTDSALRCAKSDE